MKKVVFMFSVLLLSLIAVSCAGTSPQASKPLSGCGAYGNP